MNVFLLFCLIHNIVYLFPCCLSHELFVITRKSGTSRQAEDVFTVSNNYCPDDIPQCEAFRALPSSEKSKSCMCVCGVGLKPRTTLGFQNGTFRCIKNSLFRANEGRFTDRINIKKKGEFKYVFIWVKSSQVGRFSMIST